MSKSLIPILCFACQLTIFSQSCSSKFEGSENPEVQEIWVELDEEMELSMMDFFDTLIIVPLDNRELIGSIDGISFNENGILVMDKKASKKMYYYDWEGNFIKYIGKEGEGPGEYLYHKNLQFTSPEDVVLYSNATNKLVFENLESEERKDFDLDTLGPIQDLNFWQDKYYLIRENDFGKSQIISIFNEDFSTFKEIRINDTFLSQDKAGPRYSLGASNLFFPKRDGQGFYFADVNTPYFIDFNQDVMETVYLVRFSERELDYSILNTKERKIASQISREENLVYFGNALHTHPDFLLIGYTDSGRSKMAFWDKKSSKAYPLELYHEPDWFPFGNSISMSTSVSERSDYNILYLEASMLIDALKSLEEEDFPTLNRLREMDIQRDDNPILFFYRYKEKVSVDSP